MSPTLLPPHSDNCYTRHRGNKPALVLSPDRPTGSVHQRSWKLCDSVDPNDQCLVNGAAIAKGYAGKAFLQHERSRYTPSLSSHRSDMLGRDLIICACGLLSRVYCRALQRCLTLAIPATSRDLGTKSFRLMSLHVSGDYLWNLCFQARKVDSMVVRLRIFLLWRYKRLYVTDLNSSFLDLCQTHHL